MSQATQILLDILENEISLLDNQDKDMHYIIEQILYENGFYVFEN